MHGVSGGQGSGFCVEHDGSGDVIDGDQRRGGGRGRIYDDPHCQFDLNAIVLEAFGETLLADPG